MKLRWPDTDISERIKNRIHSNKRGTVYNKILRKETEKGLLIYQNDKGLSSCAGDSGGPMVEKNEETGDFELVGITRGPVIGDKDSEYCTYRGEYTDYQFIRDWVEDKLR